MPIDTRRGSPSCLFDSAEFPKDYMRTQPSIIILHNQVQKDSPEDVLDILTQAKWIAQLLDAKGYVTRLVPFSLGTLQGILEENKKTPLLLFNLVDSIPGEETLAYLVPGILEYLHLPYTGCSFNALFSTTNKLLAKRRMASKGIDTPFWVYQEEHGGFVPSNTLRYLIKPVSEDASIGLDDNSLVVSESLQSVQAKIELKQKDTGKECFAEQFIEGREFTVCMYGSLENPKILAPYEWVFQGFEENHKDKIITYDAKWTENTFGYNHIIANYQTAEEDFPLVENLKIIARKCWEVFALSGYARVDFRIDKQNRPWVLEINGNPSFYGFYHLANEAHVPFEDILETIVQVARP
ncbi:D-alanine--D-alanine ligase [uncultured Sphaerochaeta sp.]|uniref:D-alanine--D-alanine ligase family protein n=1 Tax=uncultured Sphaerochaeta sp. TaxID=886478 RepID=UPI002A0A9C96|nr:D-alanine--D-alanine ligase [uncultured Sphaerochaeta sp.]